MVLLFQIQETVPSARGAFAGKNHVDGKFLMRERRKLETWRDFFAFDTYIHLLNCRLGDLRFAIETHFTSNMLIKRRYCCLFILLKFHISTNGICNLELEAVVVQ